MGISNIVLKAENISKIFKEGSFNSKKVLDDSSFSIFKGEKISFIGPSGCGKTTLLQICGLLDRITSGDLYINGINTTCMNDKERTLIRRKNIGFVYQMHNLLNEFSAIENVIMPLIVNNVPKKQAIKQAEQLLDKLCLFDKKYNMPSELSGGEKQRVAIARALILKPPLILADEPTGNLDYKNSINVMNLFLDIVNDYNLSFLMVTHNRELSSLTDRVITIKDCKIVEI